jgi:serine/threonine-protein kinase
MGNGMDRDDEAAQEVEAVTRRGVTERFGRYRSLGRIGRGGMAEVFLAVGCGPAGFNKLVVLKRLRDTVASDEAFREMFLDEARLAARLNHPNVVQTYEVFEDSGSFFITMEHLEGQPLGRIERECAKRGTRLKPAICARIVSDALCGLHHAHDARDYDGAPLHIVHRDVSPQNIFVTYDGQVKVVDFGIAKAELSSTKTQAGFFKGKAAYMAPEQLEGGAIDRRVDIFTAGIVLWEMLAGKRLMAAESTARTLVRLLKEPIPRVTELVDGIDPELDRIVARALQRDPEARYQTAGEMRNALDRYLVESRHFVRHEDIGRMVGELFHDARASMRHAIGEQLALSPEFPQSGTMPIGSETLMASQAPQSVEPIHPASVSGVSVSRTLSSFRGIPPPSTGIVAAAPPAKASSRLPSAVMGALVAILLVVALAIIERARMAPQGTPATDSAPLSAPAPIATRASTSVPTPTIEAAPPEVLRGDPAPASPAAVAPAPQSATRPVQTYGVSRPVRAQPAEPRPSSPASRSGAPAVATSPPPETTAAPPAPTPPAETTVARAPPTPPASSASPATSAPTTKEGRKFRTSL